MIVTIPVLGGTMQRIYKILSIIVLVLIVLCVGTPYFFGFAAKRYVFSFVRHQNVSLAKAVGVQLDVQNYHRGWFRSTADLLIQKPSNGQLVTIQKLPIYIQHGPFYKAHHEVTAGLGVIRSQDKVQDASAPYALAFDEAIAFNGEHTLLIEIDSKGQADLMPGLGFGSLVLNGKSSIDGKVSAFDVDIKDFHSVAPSNQFSLNAHHIQLQLSATHLPNQTWQMIVGLQAKKGAFDLYHVSPDQPGVSGQFDVLNATNLHVDTLKFEQLLAAMMQMQSQSASDVHQVSYGQWMTLFHEVISSAVTNDTSVRLSGLSLRTPFGLVKAEYHVSFPTLPATHDYFDVATHEVGGLSIEIPGFHLTSAQHNVQFTLTNLSYEGDSNTIFSRRGRMSFDVAELKNIQPDANNPVNLHMNGFTFNAQLQGDFNQLSQSLQWELNQLCWQANCFNKIEMDMQFLNMNTTAFRQVSNVVEQLIQEQKAQSTQQPMAVWMDLLNAYAKLIGPSTQFRFMQTVMTPKGEASIHAALSWPQLPKTPTVADLMTQSVYQVQLLFPSAYIDSFMNANPIDKITEKPTGAQQLVAWLHYAIEKGYLKQANNSYSADLRGKGQVFTINGASWKMPTNAELGLDQKPKENTDASGMPAMPTTDVDTDNVQSTTDDSSN